MATSAAVLTPTTNTAPAVVSLPAVDPSGAQWCARFPGSSSIASCTEPFRANVTSFVEALRAAGATVNISATYRPPQRAYLMHWSWMIVNRDTDPRNIPAMTGVNIQWAHVDSTGAYSSENSLRGAQDMVGGYDMRNLTIPPALNSRHTAGAAIDMSISWTGTLTINNANGTSTAITTEPRTGMNADLASVGATYWVIKYNGSGTDRPHWSDTGR